jgi:hypothetical protein
MQTAPMRKTLGFLLMTMLSGMPVASVGDADAKALIDDFSSERSRVGTVWRLVTDQVMGGISSGHMARRSWEGRTVLCMSGEVSLANNGGFVQVNLDLSANGVLDASGYEGIRLVVRGNGEVYNLHLKTTATAMPWQSYRAEFSAGDTWKEIRLPFSTFRPHRLVPALNLARLKRLGIVAIGRVMTADLCVDEIGFYR